MGTRVSIIIVTWNGLELLRQCLPSVVATDYSDFEIIVSDNASTDGSKEWIESSFPSVRVIRHPENYAFCRGNNEAIKIASGDYIVLLNNDVEVPSNWLTPLIRQMESDSTLGAVQPKLLQMDDRSRFEYSGGAGGHLDKYGYPFTRGRIFFTMEKDQHQYDSTAPIFWASGAAIVLRRAALDRVGLLDENFVLHMEEIDLCWRLQRFGYDILAVPQSEVYHIGGASLPSTDPMKTYYNFRNGLLLLYKNLPPGKWLTVFPVRALLDVVASLRLALKGEMRSSLAVLRAFYHAHKMKSLYADERGQGTRSILPDYRRSIVVDYYLRKRDTFSQLPEENFALRRVEPESQR